MHIAELMFAWCPCNIYYRVSLNVLRNYFEQYHVLVVSLVHAEAWSFWMENQFESTLLVWEVQKKDFIEVESVLHCSKAFIGVELCIIIFAI